MQRTPLPLPTHLILFGTQRILKVGLGFRLEKDAATGTDKACFFLRALGDGPAGDTNVAFPMTLDQIRTFGISCITYATTGGGEDVFLSHGPSEVVINGETILCTSFVYTRIDGVPHLMVFRHPAETRGTALKPLVQIPLTADQFRDLGIRCILYAETH